jgi:hypothetical protein
MPSRRGSILSRPLLTGLVVMLAGAAILVPVWLLLSSSSHLESRAAAGPGGSACPTAPASSRANQALAWARARYLKEAQGRVIHVDLRQIASDMTLVGALSGGELHRALVAANRQLVRHVVRIRVLRGSRVLVDANPSSFDVRGSGMELRSPNGTSLGRLQITVQDVIGFIKLTDKLTPADVVVRSGGGRMRTSLPAAARSSLPASGCTRIGSRSYVVRSFKETSFTGEPLTIWLLAAT